MTGTLLKLTRAMWSDVTLKQPSHLNCDWVSGSDTERENTEDKTRQGTISRDPEKCLFHNHNKTATHYPDYLCKGLTNSSIHQVLAAALCRKLSVPHDVCTPFQHRGSKGPCRSTISIPPYHQVRALLVSPVGAGHATGPGPPVSRVISLVLLFAVPTVKDNVAATVSSN